MTRTSLLSSFLVLAWAGMALSSPEELSLPEPIVIAHRGASGYLPEHSLASKAMAYAMKPDYIEQDVVLTKDNVPVVLHDHYLDTVTNVKELFPKRKRKDGRFYAIDFDLKEIRTLSLHERMDLKTGKAVFPKRFPLRVKIPSFKVPTLEEEIQLIQGLNHSTGNDIGLYVELKSPDFHRSEQRDISKTVLDLLKKYGYASRNSNVFIQSFDPACLQRIRNELKSKLRLVQLVGMKSWGDHPGYDHHRLLTEQGIEKIATYADGLGPSIGHLVTFEKNTRIAKPTSVIADAHKAGLLVHPYTLRSDALPGPIRSVGHACRILFHELKIDGIFTDFPDQVVEFLKRSGLKSNR